MKKGLKITLITLLSVVLIITITLFFYISNIMKDVKSVNFNKEKIISATKQINIFDKSGELINKESYNGQNIVKLSDLSDETINCFLSIEDKNFYEHSGLNYKRIAKAAFNNIKSHSFKEGASTISQQLIKNTHLSNEKTMTRKIKEMLLTKKLEKTFSKDEILETYLNIIYFGNGCYGIEEASKFYFNKPASELKIEESATLAGLIKAPSYYDPLSHSENALYRRNVVLGQLLKDNILNDEEYYNLSQKPIELSINKQVKIPDSLYISAVKQEAGNILNLTPQQITLKGYKIYTYYDSKSQESIEKTLNNNDYYHKNSYGNIADSLAVVINNKNNGIEAFYGKSDYDLLSLKRQPGSAIKPILVYAPALESGKIYNCSEILDEKIDINGYSPNNVGNIFHGYVDIRESVAKSLNIPAVKIMEDMGIENCKNFAKQAGITFNKYDNGYALALGGFNEGITLPDLVGSFTAFANNGNFRDVKFISKITTAEDKIVYENNNEFKSIMGSDTAYLVTDLLVDGVKSGTSKRLNDLNYDIAGKTGTVAIKGTNLNSDVYSVAYTTDHTMGVWLGNYSFDSTHNLEGSNNGGTYCTSMLKGICEDIYNEYTPSEFVVPDTIVKLNIDNKNLEQNHTVKLASDICPDRYKKEEIFSVRHTPNETSDIFTNFEINFDIELNDNIATISFDAQDYIIYDVYIENKLIKTIDNKSGKFTFTYSDLQPNKMYTFYIDARNNYSDTVIKSAEKSVYTKNLYEKLLDDTPLVRQDKNKNLSWYFY